MPNYEAAELAAMEYDTSAATRCEFCGLPSATLQFVSAEFPAVCNDCTELAELASN